MKVYQPQPFKTKRSSIEDIVSTVSPNQDDHLGGPSAYLIEHEHTKSLRHDISFAKQTMVEDKPLSASSNT